MKKTIKIKHVLLLSIMGLLLFMASCTKDFKNLNTNPNAPQFVPTAYLLSSTQKGLMDFTWDRWWNASNGMTLAQYYSENTYTTETQYLFRANITKQYWGNFYASGINDPGGGSVVVGGMKNLQTIIDECNATPLTYKGSGAISNQKAVATILQVWTFQCLTDIWGDIPFSQALKDVQLTQPKYDKQVDIYNGLITMLDSATSWIDVTQTDLQGDLIYAGNMNEWQKFANSLRLRVAIRIADRNPTLAGQQITKAVNAVGGVFASNADNALFTYISSAPNYNPLYYDRAINGRQDFCASNTIIDVMNTLGDGRIGYYFDSVAGAGTGNTYVGRVFGQNPGNAGTVPIGSVSQPSGAAAISSGGAIPANATLSPSAPGVYMDYAEVNFILAEAVERGFIGGSAQSYYDAGIDASFTYWTGSPAPSAYHTQATVNYSTLKSSGQTYKQIIGKQKWLALYMQGMQGWIEWRRLDFGILNQPIDGYLVGSSIPVRMLYPYDESQLDPTGYNQAINDQGQDLQSTKVWWDMY
jgi:Starch-binding associating with outer membrane